MTREEIINGLKMTMELFLFDPSTGETKEPHQLNDMDRTTYDACKGAIEALEKQEADRWIPVTERLPETTDPVNVTWTNNDPAPYYADIKGKRFTACAHYHRGKWWWYSSVCQDLLDEYGKSCMDDEIDEAIEILAWRPLPEPYTEKKYENYIQEFMSDDY